MGTLDFIAELIGAANLPEQLTAFEKRRLIERAVATIRDLHDELSASGSANEEGDLLEEIATVGRDISSMPDLLFAHALLEAADRIRTLNLQLDEVLQSRTNR